MANIDYLYGIGDRVYFWTVCPLEIKYIDIDSIRKRGDCGFEYGSEDFRWLEERELYPSYEDARKAKIKELEDLIKYVEKL
jgi:hypothetical protein